MSAFPLSSNLVRRHEQICLGIRNALDEPDALQRLVKVLRKSSGSFAIFATVRRASSFVSSLAAASPVGQSLAALLLTIG